jgi:protein-glutamine gamma-glutamyltransferase
MTAVAARAPRAVESDPTLPVPLARGLAFLALAGFGALHWMVLLDPPAPERALYALGAASVAIIGLLYAGRLGDRARPAAAIATSFVALALALLGGGIADELLRPDRWGSLVSGISRGIESLPGVRVPYRGVDEWTRTVIPLGGTVLVTAAAIAAFWPRRGRIGFPGLALTLLVALYAVPAISLDFENEFLRGAALALLVLAFLRLERLRVGDAGNAGLVAAGIAVLALMLAPALDRDTPWWDYESWALGAASARSTAFSWDHDYGPLDWPRDGRELLRVRAEKRPAYWKAANLDGFDGLRWVQEDTREDDPGVPESAEAIDDGTQEIRVTIRNLSSRPYVTAGYASEVESPTIRETPRGDGTWVAGRTLRRGDAYSAVVYTPSTNESQRREADNEAARPDLSGFRRLVLPASGETIQSGAPPWEFYFPSFEDEFTPIEGRVRGRQQAELPARSIGALEQGPYRRSWALAQQLRRQADTQEDLVQAVLRYLRRGFAYTETPPRAAYNLEGFLFDAKRGYCQQYSGAMALLLRMAGVPTRVVTGFTSGSLDTKTRE